MTTSTPVDLRTRVPNPEKCLAHPGDCSHCAWNFVTPAAPGYQPGTAPPKGTSELPGGYTGDCGKVTIVRLDTGTIGAIRRGRFHEANLDAEAFLDYLPVMGVTEADLVTA